MNPTLALLLDELSQEYRTYTDIVARLKRAQTQEEYDQVETELYDILSHLQVHSQILLETSLESLSEFNPEKVAA